MDNKKLVGNTEERPSKVRSTSLLECDCDEVHQISVNAQMCPKCGQDIAKPLQGTAKIRGAEYYICDACGVTLHFHHSND